MKKFNNNLDSFYKHGFCLFEQISDEIDAYAVLNEFITFVDPRILPLFNQYQGKIELLNAKEIPLGDDVANSFQALHFDDGHPFVYQEEQKIYLMTELYLPINKKNSNAKTRIVPIKGMFKLLAQEVEEKIVRYTEKYGDGWSYYKQGNSGRICCFAKVLEAIHDKTDLPDYIDWFYDQELSEHSSSFDIEREYYLKQGIDLDSVEEDLPLNPGSMLLFDDTRVIHGRLGKREEQELWQFLYGIKNSSETDVKELRKFLTNFMTTA